MAVSTEIKLIVSDGGEDRDMTLEADKFWGLLTHTTIMGRLYPGSTRSDLMMIGLSSGRLHITSNSDGTTIVYVREHARHGRR